MLSEIPSPSPARSTSPYLPWQLFILPPLVPVSIFAAIYASEATGSHPNAHGLAGFIALIGLSFEAGVLFLNPVLICWSVWRLATSRTRFTFASVALILFAIAAFTLAVLHLGPSIIRGW
jgi:hypothetical protein